MVLSTGLEPVRHFCRWIFVLLYVTIATFLCCSLEHVFTISYSDLGSWCMSSTHLFFKIFLFQRNLARRSVFAFAVLANFYSKSFLLGTLCKLLAVPISRENTPKSIVFANFTNLAYSIITNYTRQFFLISVMY